MSLDLPETQGGSLTLMLRDSLIILAGLLLPLVLIDVLGTTEYISHRTPGDFTQLFASIVAMVPGYLYILEHGNRWRGILIHFTCVLLIIAFIYLLFNALFIWHFQISIKLIFDSLLRVVGILWFPIILGAYIGGLYEDKIDIL